MTKATLVLERLGSADTISSKRAESILLGLSEVADPAAKIVGLREFYGPEIWNVAERLFANLLPRIAKRRRSAFLAKFFGGSSLGWLNTLFRREYFVQGRFGDGRRGESEWRLSSTELDAVITIMQARFKNLAAKQLFGLPKAASILFAWLQSGDADGPRKLVAGAARTDAGFIGTLEKLSGRVIESPGGESITLSRENLAPFLDYDSSRTRLARISKGKSALAARAKALVAAIEDDWR